MNGHEYFLPEESDPREDNAYELWQFQHVHAPLCEALGNLKDIDYLHLSPEDKVLLAEIIIEAGKLLKGKPSEFQAAEQYQAKLEVENELTQDPPF